MTNAISLETLNFHLTRLDEGTVIKPFESEDEDLNDFLFNDAKNYMRSLLAATYLLQTTDETIAYYCLSNDRITKDEEEKSTWNKINRAIANEKRRKSYPAVKIGRLAVSRKYARSGFGKMIIDAIIKMYVSGLQQAGCRFITVDAYRKATHFYEKNDFKYLTDKDGQDETRAMYLDLKAYLPHPNHR
jgi:GNAT superfamily N-acetyltransferase